MKLAFELAAVVGVDPLPRTMRELVWMNSASRFEAWKHTASILCTLAEPHRDKWKHPGHFEPAEFMPEEFKPERLKRGHGFVPAAPSSGAFLDRLIAKFGAVPVGDAK